MLARTIIETLAKGINPLTGWILSENDSCAQEEIQEALTLFGSAYTQGFQDFYTDEFFNTNYQNVILLSFFNIIILTFIIKIMHC